MVTTGEVQTAAELERQRLARQASTARAGATEQAQAAQAQTETQATRAISQTQQQAKAAREQASREAATRQAEIRKSQGKAERLAQTAMAKARQARNIEARKVVLPFSKPQDLNIGTYIASVEAARKEAHRTGQGVRTTITRVRDQYFRQVDQAEADAIAAINTQKAGTITGIQKQLTAYNADLTKQIAKLNSGIDSWESEATAAINKAQADYAAAIQAQLDKPGPEVFADLKDRGLVPANAIYASYDKSTGQLDYTIPDPRTGTEIFAAEQQAGNIPASATFKDYDSSTGQLTYAVPDTDKPQTQTAGATNESTNVVSAAAGVVMAGAAVITLPQAGAAVAAIPTPPTWAIGGIMVVAGLIIAYINRNKIKAGIDRLTGNADRDAASSAVVTNQAGSVAYTIQQLVLQPQTKEGSTTTLPLAQAKSGDIADKFPTIEPYREEFRLTQESWQPQGLPLIKQGPEIIIRDTFDQAQLRQKGSTVLAAVAGVQTAANRVGRIAQQELQVTRADYNRLMEQVNEHLHQGRVRAGQRILQDMARGKDVTIARSFRLAYEDYLRKKAILDAARKAYVASLNPRPIKGRGSTGAKAAAIGVWLAQDILQDTIAKALARGETLESAMDKAQAKVREASVDLGISQQQINAASVTVVQNIAISNMAQEAVNTVNEWQNQGLTDTQLQTKTFTAMKQAINTATQTAVNTHTITQTQANTMTNELTRVAEQTAALTTRIKLPWPTIKAAGKAGDQEYPAGTIVWNMGNLRGKGVEYKIIPPPYDLKKPITSFIAPKGMTRTRGTPQQTLTFIGGKVPFSNVSFDLGVTDGFIDVKRKTIRFTGGGEHTDVGTRLPETTRGVALASHSPLLQQLANRPRPSRVMAKSSNLMMARQNSGNRPRLETSGVYADRKGQRLARKHHRGWKRIY